MLYTDLPIDILIYTFKEGRRVMNQKGINLDWKYLRDKDEQFDKSDFEKYTENVFMKLQKAWTDDYKNDTWNDDLRQYMTDDLFNFYKKQLNRLKRSNQANIIKRIYCYANILAYKEIENYDLLAVKMSGNLIDYIVDLDTNKKIMGDTNEKINFEYVYIYIRPIASRDPESLKSLECAYCGAPIDPGASNRCPYCDGINITENSPKWILCRIHKGQPYEFYDVVKYIDEEEEEEVIEVENNEEI